MNEKKSLTNSVSAHVSAFVIPTRKRLAAQAVCLQLPFCRAESLLDSVGNTGGEGRDAKELRNGLYPNLPWFVAHAVILAADSAHKNAALCGGSE